MEATDQSSRAEKDHEDDEGLEPAVLNDLVTGLPSSPPHLTQARRGVNVTALEPGHADCGGQKTDGT